MGEVLLRKGISLTSATKGGAKGFKRIHAPQRNIASCCAIHYSESDIRRSLHRRLILSSKNDDHALELRTIAFGARGPSCVLLVYASEDGGAIHIDSLATGNGIEVGKMGMRRHTMTTIEAANLMRTIREELDRARQLSQSKNARK
jgi:hypothetical protein